MDSVTHARPVAHAYQSPRNALLITLSASISGAEPLKCVTALCLVTCRDRAQTEEKDVDFFSRYKKTVQLSFLPSVYGSVFFGVISYGDLVPSIL